jgi:hypothetical protein
MAYKEADARVVVSCVCAVESQEIHDTKATANRGIGAKDTCMFVFDMSSCGQVLQQCAAGVVA